MIEVAILWFMIGIGVDQAIWYSVITDDSVSKYKTEEITYVEIIDK